MGIETGSPSSPSDASSNTGTPARLLRLEDLRAIREMSSDQFAQYAKGFSDQSSQAFQQPCGARKRKRVRIPPSVTTHIRDSDSSDSTQVTTSSEFEEIPPPSRRTRSIRIQKKSDDYVWNDDSDETN